MKMNFCESVDLYIIYSDTIPVGIYRTKQRAIMTARKLAERTKQDYIVFKADFSQKINFSDYYLTHHPIYIMKGEV